MVGRCQVGVETRETLWLIPGCPGLLYWAVTGRDLVRDSSSRGERAGAEDWGRAFQLREYQMVWREEQI